MRTRRQSKLRQTVALYFLHFAIVSVFQGVGEQEATDAHHVSESIDENEALSNISRNAVGKLLKRVKKGFNKEDVSYLRHCESSAKMERRSTDNDNKSTDADRGKDRADSESYYGEAMEYAYNPEKVETNNGSDDSEWEDGSIPTISPMEKFQKSLASGVSVEFDVSHASAKRKPIKRATAEEKVDFQLVPKEVAEFVHKAHLLCLLGRGRLIDSACDDPLIQASLLSLVPADLLKITELPNLTAKHLSPLVSWFHNNFHISCSSVAEESYHLALASAVETREGPPEMVAALSVALFRALNLTTRFVSILDVISLKPDADKLEFNGIDGCKSKKDIFSSSTLMVAGPSAYSVKSSPDFERGSSEPSVKGPGKVKDNKSRKQEAQTCDFFTTDKPKDQMTDVLMSEAPTNTSESCLVKSDGLKRKGDIEFQMQLEMALAATAGVNPGATVTSNASESPSTSSLTPPSKRLKKIRQEESHECSTGMSTAIGSKKVGAPLYWAEVFCSGDNLTGKWVHVDAVNAIVDGENKVEAAAAACRKSLRYVVAFAGNGAKDVTRRYCTKWYKVAAQRVDSTWWDAVLRPLMELESRATGGIVNVKCEALKHEKIEVSQESPARNSFAPTRSSLEDMELETRALTEPLPTNQQAYRGHHLYVIERWLKKYEILYPKGPVLGFCSGHAVYPRTCVQTLHTKDRWLREGLQVKAGEVPVKVLKRSSKDNKEDIADDNDFSEGDHQGITNLYGKWQTEPLCLPQAINGIVPKNERGRVDVWSEKCLPPGTVHLPLPRVAAVAKRLDIDYAPAMVGFDFRNGRSVPSFEGIVVCSEFKDAILEAYFEEEEKREAEEKRKTETQALSRWYQLLSSIVTRQRLNESYANETSTQSFLEISRNSGNECLNSSSQKMNAPEGSQQVNTKPNKCDGPPETVPSETHEHVFILDDEFGEGGSTQVKRCQCGFSIQFEEL
ncbi:DNA repair protein Rad4 family [Striga asiatica]|uniref:DNA repair protein Rad4 family n=1 Tax=Striga asiatica TaxID=4170 RepID=A0A5A7PPK2_STRAF|nr:DNA repair protein Rad4 family [Striga asiatica]